MSVFLSCFIEALVWCGFIKHHSPEDMLSALPNMRCSWHKTFIVLSPILNPLSNTPLRIIETEHSLLFSSKRHCTMSQSVSTQWIERLAIPIIEFDGASSLISIFFSHNRLRTSVLCCPLATSHTVSEGKPLAASSSVGCGLVEHETNIDNALIKKIGKALISIDFACKGRKNPRVEEYQATISYILNINNTHFRIYIYASVAEKYASNKHFMTYIA